MGGARFIWRESPAALFEASDAPCCDTYFPFWSLYFCYCWCAFESKFAVFFAIEDFYPLANALCFFLFCSLFWMSIPSALAPPATIPFFERFVVYWELWKSRGEMVSFTGTECGSLFPLCLNELIMCARCYLLAKSCASKASKFIGSFAMILVSMKC